MKRLVLDCSVTMAWCFEDEEDSSAESLLDDTRQATIHVPCVWTLEVANVLLVGERRGRLSEAKVKDLLNRIQQMPVEQEPAPDSQTVTRILSLARRYGLSAYDAAYLELAMRLGIPLATLDERLRKAADAAGVKSAL